MSEDRVMKELFNDALCLRELLIRMGFDTNAIHLGISEDLKTVALVLEEQGKEIALVLAPNRWSKNELQAAWEVHVNKYRELLGDQKGIDYFHKEIWLKSNACRYAAQIVQTIIDKGFRIPALEKYRKDKKPFWGQA